MWFEVSAGDLNGDGISDVIIGAPYSDYPSTDDAGIAYVIFGRNIFLPGATSFSDVQLTNGASALPAGVGFRILGAFATQYLGSTLGCGDVNGDGIDDIIVGAFGGPSGSNTYVVFGRNGSSLSFGDVYLPSTTMADDVGFRVLASGYSVCSAGDVNGDDIGDLITGAHTADPPSQIDAGISYVIFGRNLFIRP